MAVQTLIQQCWQRDSAAWSEFLVLMVNACSQPVQRAIRSCGLAPGHTEDILQDLLVYLLEDDLRRLRGFRGRSRAELAGFLRTIARRFTYRWVEQYMKPGRQEATMGAGSDVPDESGPSEPEVAAIRNELLEIMSVAERKRLRLLEKVDSTSSSPENGIRIPPRTIRHWRLELTRKYRDRV